MEQYLTHEGYLQDRIAGILQTLIEIGPKVVENPKDYALASNLCELYHGIKRPNTKGVPSDWATHMIGHELLCMESIMLVL
jgi:NADP-dependent alcohol dehydrogenase